MLSETRIRRTVLALAARVSPSTEIVRGDVLDRASLDAALRGVDAACYLVPRDGVDR